MRGKLIIIGGGEHARVVAEAAKSRAGLWDSVGFVDSQPCYESCVPLNMRQFGSDEEALRHATDYWFVLGIGRIGSTPLRHKLVAFYTAGHARWASVVHATASISPTAVVGEGTVIFAGAVANAGAVVGSHCVINTGAIVEHDVQIGDFGLVGPGAVVGGGAKIGEDAYLGLGCRIRDHLQIGRGVTVGMSAAVVKAVPDGAQVVGVPAKTSIRRCK